MSVKIANFLIFAALICITAGFKISSVAVLCIALLLSLCAFFLYFKKIISDSKFFSLSRNIHIPNWDKSFRRNGTEQKITPIDFLKKSSASKRASLDPCDLSKSNAKPSEETSSESGDVIDLGIDNYDQLVAAEVLPSLETLSIDELKRVIVFEKKGLNRLSIIERAKKLIELDLKFKNSSEKDEVVLDLSDSFQKSVKSKEQGLSL